MNSWTNFKKRVERIKETLRFNSTDLALEPSRIVNRALYGTDYDPKEVALKYKFNTIKYNPRKNIPVC